MKTAEEIFEAEMKKRGIVISPLPDEEGVYEFEQNGGKATVSLENIRRVYNRDKDPEEVVRFVDTILKSFAIPPWDKVKNDCYLSVKPVNLYFEGMLYEKVTASINKVYVFDDKDKNRIIWVNQSNLGDWGITRNEFEKAALQNLNRLIEDKSLVVVEVDGKIVASIAGDSEFNASLIFAPNFKSFVSTRLEWPVLVMIPCRDFVVIISEKDKDLLNRLEDTIREEYRNSGYPITTEVLRISDDGIKAVRKFPE